MAWCVMPLEHFLLLLLLALPTIAAVVVALLGPNRGALIRWFSLAASLATLAIALFFAIRVVQTERQYDEQGIRTAANAPTFQPLFVPGSPGIRAGTDQPDPFGTSWNLVELGPGAIQFYIGLDGLNIWLVVLTAVLMLPSVLVSWTHISERVHEFYAWLLALQTTMMGIFLAFDIILFYVFFELSLVPLFFLIGIWGGPQRRYAARKFFIYTFLGSMITLLGIIGLVLQCYYHSGQAGEPGILTFSIPRLVELVHTRLITSPAAKEIQFWVFMALMVGFAVKVPLVPFHTWLPLAHVEAPTAGSVDLAGVLLKVGAYGFLRLCIPLAPDVSLALGLPLVTTLAAIGIVYGALCAYSQDDVKKLIAYSSVSHLGMCMLGLFTLNVVGISGGIMYMINHGLSTAALFLLIGMIYERYHTRNLSDYSGMAAKMPVFASFLVFISMASAGLPGLNGFVGELLVLAGIFQHRFATNGSFLLPIVAASGILLGAWYLLTMLRRLLFGPIKEPDLEVGGHGLTGDMNFREISLIAPIAALCLLLGVYPQPVLRTMEPDVLTVANIAERARDRAGVQREEQPVSQLDTTFLGKQKE
ncbi:MAG: NADH:ubiquinone oxidoreductase subunit M [Gemmatales bacterium]|nr:MAG: NADH:ubiquinone oxidoreductase subunit M [Gemmatales bacterium]